MKLRVLFVMLCLAAVVPMSRAQEGARIDGVTVRVWDLGAKLERMPRVVEGQTPNVALDAPTIDFKDAWSSGVERLERRFAGHVVGWLDVPTDGTYGLRLSADDGAQLSLDGREILPEPGEVHLTLERGLRPIEIRFYQDGGPFHLRLEWAMPDNPGRFETIPQRALRTSAGQTHVVSPGRKRRYHEGPGAPGGPGDARPLDGVHPAFTLETIRPTGFEPAVGGMAFLPDGRLCVCTWDEDGCVYILDGLRGDGSNATATKFASGLGEPLGIAVVDGRILISQKQEVTELIDVDGDGVADEYNAIAYGWPASYNYHEFTFNLVHHDDALWVATSVPLKGGWTMYLDGTSSGLPVDGGPTGGPGSLLRIDPSTGQWERFSHGLRTPNGLGVGPGGALFGCDNQGCWMPVSRLNRYTKDGFYGHQPTSVRTIADEQPPVVWFPQGEIGNSPAEPVLIPDGQPLAGQLLVGDVTHGGIKRVFVEEVDGVWQGCVFRHSQGLEAGINRLVWGPDGALYCGGIGSNGNWNHDNTEFGLQRLRPNGAGVFEIESVRPMHAHGTRGLMLTFTHPGRENSIGARARYEVRQWRYVIDEKYGGPKIDEHRIQPRVVLVSPDRRRVYVDLPDLKDGHVAYLRMPGFMNADGDRMWSSEAWATVNTFAQMDPDELAGFRPGRVPTRPVSAQLDADTVELQGAQIASEWAPRYIDFIADTEAQAAWTCEIASSGDYRIRVKYALADGERAMACVVNGSDTSRVQFTATGSWRTWAWRDALVTLHEGTNTIALRATGQSGPNVMELRIEPALGTKRIGAPPPEAAQVLFDGQDVSAWRQRDGGPFAWKVDDGELQVNQRASDLFTAQRFGDAWVHVEWKTPEGGRGQRAGNSGVKLQSRYEVQVLAAAPGDPKSVDGAGAIYGFKAPDENASLGNGQWQAFDIWFQRPRFEEGHKVSHARMTAYWNGKIIHDDVRIPRPTGLRARDESGEAEPLLLQSHASDARDDVRYRNIWVLEPPNPPKSASIRCRVGRPMHEYQCTAPGGEWFTISPPLPDGLTLDPRHGVISGRPLEPYQGTHRLSCVNSVGVGATVVTIRVQP